MSTAATVSCVGVGITLLALAVVDIFHQLFHPAGRGWISDQVMRLVYTATRAATRAIAPQTHRALARAGPVGIVVVVVLWGTMLAIGWALIYLPFLPAEFDFSSGLSGSERQGFGTSLYLSLVTLGTLGYGDIAPTAGLLRLFAPIEAFMGFALLSAAITWVLSLYPVLVRNRSLAQEVHTLLDAGILNESGLRRLGEGSGVDLLARLAERVVVARVDFVTFSAIQFFQSVDERSSLPAALLALHRWSREAQGDSMPEPVRMQANVLERALAGFAETVAHEVLRCPELPTTETALEAYLDYERPEVKPAAAP